MQSDLPPLSPVVREQVERAYRTRADRVREIVECARQRFPHYRALSAEELERVSGNIDRAIGAFYLMELIEGREPDPRELETQRRSARERLAQGIPLDELVGTYRLALPILWTHLVKCLEAEGEAAKAELLHRVPLTISCNTDAVTAVTEAYVEERERRAHTYDRAIADLLALCLDEEASLDTLGAHARAHPLDPELPVLAIYCRPTPADAEVLSLVDFVRHELDAARITGVRLIGPAKEGIVVLLGERVDRAFLASASGKLRDRGWRVGLGGPAVGTAGLRRAVREGVRAAELAERLGRDEPLSDYRDLAVFDLVKAGSVQATEFARRVLGPMLDADASPAHLETLRALCANGFSRKVTAAALDIHPHTLAYRVKLIRQRYDIDVEDPDSRLRVQLAMLILGD